MGAADDAGWRQHQSRRWFVFQIFYHHWLYSGAGNANFYYAIGLVFVMAQVDARPAPIYPILSFRPVLMGRSTGLARMDAGLGAMEAWSTRLGCNGGLWARWRPGSNRGWTEWRAGSDASRADGGLGAMEARLIVRLRLGQWRPGLDVQFGCGRYWFWLSACCQSSKLTKSVARRLRLKQPKRPRTLQIQKRAEQR